MRHVWSRDAVTSGKPQKAWEKSKNRPHFTNKLPEDEQNNTDINTQCQNKYG